MVASTDIKFYVHTNTNAPQLTNNYGCMIDVLDACLVNGFGSQTVSTLTASGTTVTATFGSAHNFMQYQVIEIAGATQTEYNGEHRILTVQDANTITFELAAVPSVTTATGTITSSLPSLGWEKPFSSTGKAAYRSKNLLLASRPFLRVVDALDPAYTSTYAKYAKVGIVEDMTDIDTMLGVQAPFDALNPNKNWVGTGSGTSAINGWAKWYYARAAAPEANSWDNTGPTEGNRPYVVIGTPDYFYIFPCTHHIGLSGLSYGFGAFESFLNTDSSNTFLSASVHYAAANAARYVGDFTGIDGYNASIGYKDLLILKPYTQNNKYVAAKTASLAFSNNYSGSADSIGGVALTGIAPFSPVFIKESVLRGRLRGIYHLFQNKPYTNKQFIKQSNEVFMAIDVAPGNIYLGQIVVKVGVI